MVDLTGVRPKNKEIDEVAKNVFKNSLRFTGKLGVISSEGDRPVLLDEAYNSPYMAVLDPLDGSSNIALGISTGTIFGLYKESDYCLLDNEEEVSTAEIKRLLKTLQPGSNLIAAGYCMYDKVPI